MNRARLGDCADALDALPPVIGGPLGEWAAEDDPRLALWHACDAVEMVLRLAVALGLGEHARAGGAPAEIRAEIARRIEQPTLGRWRGMAAALAARPAAGSALGALWRWIGASLEPLLGGEDPARSLGALRNRLAHGGGLSHALAAELLATWEPRLAGVFGGLAHLRAVRLVAVGAGVVLRGDLAAIARGEELAAVRATGAPPEAVVAVTDDGAAIPLWPLVTYDTPPGEARPVTQVYVRRGEVRLVMTPLGAERAAVAESSEAAVSELVRIAGTEPPRVEYEIAGFESELRRDAAACIGRAAEVEAVRAACEGGAGLRWLGGAPGSGKSLVLARAVHDVPGRVVFRFRAGDARATRDGFLRFVVERLAQLAGAEPPRGKPLREQARELAGALAGRAAIVVDGLDETAAIDPGFTNEVLVPLGRAIRVVAAGRPPGPRDAVEIFAGGLPPMSAADVRAMLLDKIGPLSKRLIALDRERGAAVVNPFVDAVVARAEGLPVYVTYVIGDVLAGRLRDLDAAELPPSLAAYHAAVLRRGGAGNAQQLVTPLVATLACALEPLGEDALHALMVDRVLTTADLAGRHAVSDALAQLAGQLRRHEPGARFALFHPSLRDHVLASPDQAIAVATARIALARAARARPPALDAYLDAHGVAHLLAVGDVAGAVEALAFDRIARRVANLSGVIADLRATSEAGGDVGELLAFVRGAAHHVERGGLPCFLQAALADGDASPITRAAEAIAPPGLVRRLDRPPRPLRGARQRTMVGHVAPVRALAGFGDVLVSAAGDGALRVWDGDDGSALRTLLPPAASLAATTRAAMPRAPVDVAGTMPQLAVHAVCAAAGAVIATYGDGMVRRWDVERGVVLAEARIGTFGWDACALGDRVAIAGDDGTLHILDARTLAPVDRVQGLAIADGAPYLLGVAVVGAALVVAGASRGLAILDPDTLAVRGELRAETAPPRALAAVPDAPWLLSVDRDGAVALWDVAARRLLGRAPGDAVSVAALPSTRGRAPLVGMRDGTVARLTLPGLEVERVAAVHAGAVDALLALPDGRALTGGADRAVRLVDLDLAAASRPAHAGAVTALAVTTHPRLAVVTGGADGNVKLWDARGRSLRTIPTGARVAGVAIAADGADLLLYSTGARALVHRVRPDGTVTTTPGDPPPPPPAPPRDLTATVGRDDVVTITRGGTVVGRWSCDATPQALVFADDRTLVLGDAAGEVTLLALD